MTVRSTPDCSRCIAVVCRIVCGLTRFFATDGIVAMLNRTAEVMFGVSARDVGRPSRDLDSSYPPVEPRKRITQAQLDSTRIRVDDVRLATCAAR